MKITNDSRIKTYELIFKGYWIEDNISDITNASGIYLVYRCIHYVARKEVSLKEILYIGQATNLNERINNHDQKELFINACHVGETLCYSVAEVEENNLDVVENALIFAQKPRLNTNLKYSYNHEMPVAFMLEGRCSLMKLRNFKILGK